MSVGDFFNKHPTIGGWLLGSMGAIAVGVLGLGYVVVYRIPDQDKKQDEVIKNIEDLRKSLKTDMEKMSGEHSHFRQESSKWQDSTTQRVRTVHLLACEAVRKRSDACAMVMMTASVERMAPHVAQVTSSVKISVEDQSKPLLVNEAVAGVVGASNLTYVTLEEYGTFRQAKDQKSIEQTVGFLMGAEPSNFTVADGLINVQFNNGSAVIVPASNANPKMMSTMLNNTVELVKAYGLYVDQKPNDNRLAAYKADAAFGQLQRLSVQHRVENP